MKTQYKIIIIAVMLIIFMASFFMINCCYAEDLGLGDLNKYKSNPKTPAKLSSRVGKILSIIQVIGTVVSVAMLMVIGIKFMVGSLEERAEYKESLKPYLIGAFLLFTGTFVPEVIYKFSQSMQ